MVTAGVQWLAKEVHPFLPGNRGLLWFALGLSGVSSCWSGRFKSILFQQFRTNPLLDRSCPVDPCRA